MSASRTPLLGLIATFAGVLATVDGCRCESAPSGPVISASASGAAPTPAAPVLPDRFGDPMPPGAVGRLGSARMRHASAINSVAFADDGTSLLTAGDDGAIRLWKVEDGRELGRLEGHDAPVEAAAFVEGGKRVLSIDQRGSVRLWDLKTGAAQVLLPGSPENRLYDATISSGGAIWWSKLPYGSGHWSLGTRSVYETSELGGSTGIAGDARGVILESQAGGGRSALLGRLDGPKANLTELGNRSGFVGAAALSGSQALVATGERDGTVRLFDGSSSAPIRELGKTSGRVTSLAFSRDESALLVLSDDRVATLVPVGGGPPKWSARIADGEVEASALSPDGRLAAVADGNVVVLIDASTGAVVRPEDGHRSPVQALAFSPDGSEIIAGAHDGVIRRWDVDRAEALASYRSGFPVSSLAVAPDGDCFVVNLDHDVGLFAMDARVPRILVGHSARVTAVAFAEQEVVSGDDDGHVFRWSPDSARIVARYPTRPNGIGAIAVSPDAALIAATAAGVPSNKLGAITLFDLSTTGVTRELSGHEGWATAALFSSDGSLLASVGWDSRIRGFDVATGTELFNGRLPREIQKLLPGVLAFTASGNIALANDAGGVVLRDRSGAQVEYETRELDAASLAASPDGSMLAVGAWDGTIVLYRAP